MVDEVVQPGLGGVAVADVAHHGHAHRFAVLHGATVDHFDGDARAVLVDHAGLEGDVLLAVELPDGAGVVLRRDQHQGRTAQQIMQRQADQLAQGGVGVVDVAVAVEEDALDAGLQELGQAFLGFEQRALGGMVAALVDDEHVDAGAAALRVEVRRERDLDPQALAIAQGQRLLQREGLTVLQGTGQYVGELGDQFRLQHIGQRPSQRGARRVAQALHEGPVGIGAELPRTIEVGHHDRRTVGQAAQLVPVLPGVERASPRGGVVSRGTGGQGHGSR